MADLPTTTPTDTVVPAHVLAQKRRQRATHQRLLTNTMAAQALDEEEATQPSPASPFSDDAVAIYGRMDDGSAFVALIDPSPPEEAS